MFSSSPSQVERQRPGSADRRRHSQDNVPREDRGSDDGASSGHSGLFVSDDDRFASPSEPVAKPVPQPRRFAPFEVQVPAVKRRKAYVDYHDELVVSKVIKEAFSVNGQVTYEVRCGDGERVMVCILPAVLTFYQPSSTGLFLFLSLRLPHSPLPSLTSLSRAVKSRLYPRPSMT